MAVALALAESTHHSAQRQKTARAGRWDRGELHGQGPEHPTLQAAGTQYFSTAVDDEEVPATERPAPLLEVLPQAGLGRHGGIGYELVLSFAVPQGLLEAETALPAFLKREKEKEEAKEKEKAMTRNVTVQEIPEVQGGVPSRVVTPQGRNSKRIAGQEPQAIPQERISEQIGGKVPRVIPPRRISERIEEQTVEVPGLQTIPQKRISKRIVEQNVDVSELHDIPQERISERIEGRIGGFLSTSSPAAVPLDTAEWLGDRGFSHFPRAKKKCDVSAAVECEHAVALELMDAGAS